MIVLELKKTISYISMKQGRLFIISAPSGAGKTSLISHVTDMRSDIKVSISHTTRLPRPKEKDGVDYFFIQKNQPKLIYCDSANVVIAYILTKIFPKKPIVVRVLGVCSFWRAICPHRPVSYHNHPLPILAPVSCVQS